MTSHANCTHPATKKDRAACRAAQAKPALTYPTIFAGTTEVRCELCANEDASHRYARVDDLRHIPCPCDRRWDDGTAYGARYRRVDS